MPDTPSRGRLPVYGGKTYLGLSKETCDASAAWQRRSRR
jgi:hypothetical protein